MISGSKAKQPKEDNCSIRERTYVHWRVLKRKVYLGHPVGNCHNVRVAMYIAFLIIW